MINSLWKWVNSLDFSFKKKHVYSHCQVHLDISLAEDCANLGQLIMDAVHFTWHLLIVITGIQEVLGQGSCVRRVWWYNLFCPMHVCMQSVTCSFSAVFVQVTDDGTAPTLGQEYNLTCNVSGASVFTYEWRKDGTVLPETGLSLSFQPDRLSDAGLYTCTIYIYSWFLRSSYSSSAEVILQSQ